MRGRSFFTIIFAIVFLAAIVTIAYAHGPGRKMGSGQDWQIDKGLRHRGIDTCLDKLDLTSEQIAQIKTVRKEHRENMGSIKEDMNIYRTRLREQVLKETDFDQNSFDEIINQGSEVWKEMERERLRYLQQVSELLTQEQKDKISSFTVCRDY